MLQNVRVVAFTVSKLLIKFKFPIQIFFLDCIFATVISLPKIMKFSVNDFFSKYDQIRRKLQIWSRLLKKS